MERLSPPSGRSLVFGASGLVGKEIFNRLSSSDVRGYAFSNPAGKLIPFDVSDTAKLREEIITQRPTTVFWTVNMAGGVNGCETDPDRARTMHFETTRALVDACLLTQATLVFISTDYVFSDSEKARDESESPIPLNVYGRLKAESEALIQSRMKNFIIARTTNIYGWDPDSKTPNFYMQAFQKLSRDESLSVPAILYGNPTYVGDLVDGILGLLNGKHHGLFHVVGPENISRLDWAKKIGESLGKAHLIQEMRGFENKPKRPLRVELSTQKIRKKISYRPKTVAEGLNILTKIRNQSRH